MANFNLESEKRESAKGFWAIFPDYCKGCGLCIVKCPVKCISWSEGLGVYGTPRVKADMEKCILCGICQQVCPDTALRVEKNK